MEGRSFTTKLRPQGEVPRAFPAAPLGQAHSPARVNLVLFEADEIGRLLPRSDRRVGHVLDVLRRGIGEPFDAGVINGPRGRARLATVAADTVTPTPTIVLAMIVRVDTMSEADGKAAPAALKMATMPLATPIPATMPSNVAI
ncbi:MAG: hypothetical protein RLZZ221_2452, partial [Verrucomicrobiota bacterium]